MTGALATPRYSNDDFETASIRSAAPSYDLAIIHPSSSVSRGCEVLLSSPRERHLNPTPTDYRLASSTCSSSAIPTEPEQFSYRDMVFRL
ncbi:hypothetical protein LB503_006796 [Fusarium chuoi]|nr:hypothetical protein LB503_006796 [Fusarium chuoi]